MTFLVKDKEVYYKDRIFSKFIRIVPEDKVLIAQIKAQEEYQKRFSPMQVGLTSKMFELSDEEKKEYLACKTDEDIVNLIKRDALSKGCLFINELREETK